MARPRRVRHIRFIGRNDGNGIEVGNDYELLYWDGHWRSFGRVSAADTKLVFRNVPSGRLYVLSNLTKGHEERIFTYVDGEQICGEKTLMYLFGMMQYPDFLALFNNVTQSTINDSYMKAFMA